MLEQTQFIVEDLKGICKIQVLSHLASAPITSKFKEIIDNTIQKNRCRKILFDLTKVEFVDSSFIGAIVYAYKILNNINGKICCVIKSATVSDRFLVSQLDRLFNIFSDYDEALHFLMNE